MDDVISDRLLDQRLRNRMAEALTTLVDWEDMLTTHGAGEYFNWFFDFFPDQPPLPPNSAVSDAERAALIEVVTLMDEAASATPQDVTEEQLRGSGWPQRIAPVADAALGLMRERGRFSDEQEEEHASGLYGF